MATELWLGIAHYSLSVLIVFALLVALMEASRKYDRFRQPSYLWLATGYFLLVVWILLMAVSIVPSILESLAVIAQLLGFGSLTIGYYQRGKTHEAEEDLTVAPIIARGNTKSTGWLSLLTTPPIITSSVDEEKEQDEVPDQLTTSDKSDGSDEDKLDAVESEAEVPTTETVEPIPAQSSKVSKRKSKRMASSGEVDLSYLANRQRKDKAPSVEPLVESYSKPAAEETARKETREEMMDDLFPLNQDAQSETKIAPNSPKNTAEEALLPSERPVASKEVKKAMSKKRPPKPPKSVAPALLLAGSGLEAVWPDVVLIFFLALIILCLLPHRHQRGNGWLLTGFGLLLGLQLVLLSGALPLDSLGPAFAIGVAQVMAYGCLGIAGWYKIKGKVTHHFIKIVSLVYLTLLVLTIGLAFLIVRDTASLQLLLILMTGVIITILPIIHALTYNHPHQPKVEGDERV